MDRYYTMRPINLAGEVEGYRAELVGVGSGADALRTIMQTAIQRVGVSITPIVCQQLFIEVFNAAVDFACDAGTSVNLADIISFKWNTRGKYDRIDAVVPKSALSLTAIVSPKITRNATPHFDLKLQPVTPTFVKVDNPLDTLKRGVIAAGYSLANVKRLRLVDATTRAVYVTYTQPTEFYSSDNGRQIIAVQDGVLVAPITGNPSAALEFSMALSGDDWTDSGLSFKLVDRSSGSEVLSATPQPFNLKGSTELVILGNRLPLDGQVRIDDAYGNHLALATSLTMSTASEYDANPSDFELLADFSGGPALLHILDASGNDVATFYINLTAYTR